MTEALNIAPDISNGATPESRILNLAEIPYHLRRRTLMKIRNEEGSVPEKLWNDRGDAVEVRTQGIIASQSEIVESVTMNARHTKGSDLTVKFIEGFPVEEVLVEIKSSHLGIRDRKQKIRDILAIEGWNQKSSQEKELAISGWLTENGVILINGGEEDLKEKTPEEILNDSFYPQLERIRQKALRDRSIPVQIFPEAQTA